MTEVRRSTVRTNSPQPMRLYADGTAARDLSGRHFGPRESGPGAYGYAQDLDRPLGGLPRSSERSLGVTGAQGRTADRLTGRKKPAPDPKVVRKGANELYKAMHGGLGWGTDESRLFKALKGKSPEEIAAIRKEYKDHYGRDLDHDLKDELSGSDLKRATALMKAKHDSADADALRQAMKGMGTDEKAIMQTLKGKSPDQIKKIKAEYRKRHGRSLEGDLKSELSGRDLDQAKALLNSDKAGSTVADLRRAMEGMGTDEAAVYKALEGKSAKERAAIAKAYKKQTGRELRGDLKSEMSGAELTRAESALKGDNAGVAAARLDEAMRGMGTNEKEIYTVLEGKSARERAAIRKAYKQQTGRELRGDLKGEMSGTELQRANSLYRDGKLTSAEQIRFATAGLGTDEEAIRKALKGKSKTEIAAIRKEYKLRYGRSLDSVLKSELSGRDAFEANQALKGKPQNVLEALQRANEGYKYERGGSGNSFGSGVVDLISSNGELLDRNHKRANDFAKKALADGHLSADEKSRLEQLVGFQSDDTKTYQETKDSVSDTVATAGAAVASSVAVLATGGAATPLLYSVLASAGAGAGARAGLTAAIQGNSYGSEDLMGDLALGAVEGIGVKGGALAGKAARKSVEKGIVSAGRRRLAGAVVEGLADGAVDAAIASSGELALRDGTWDNGFGRGLGDVFTGGVTAALTGAAVTGVKAYPLELLGSGAGRLASRGWAATGQGVERMVSKMAMLRALARRVR